MGRRPDTIRVSLRMTQDAKQQLDDVLARSQSENLTEVVRRALSLYDALLSQQEKGHTIVLRNDETGDEREVMLIF